MKVMSEIAVKSVKQWLILVTNLETTTTAVFVFAVNLRRMK